MYFKRLLFFIILQIMYFFLSYKSVAAALQNGSLPKDSYEVALKTNEDSNQFRDMIGQFSVVWNESEIYTLTDVVFYVILENVVHNMTVTLLIDNSVIERNVTLTRTTAFPDWVKARVPWYTAEGAYVGSVRHEFNCSQTDATVVLDVQRPGGQKDHLRSVSVVYIQQQPMKVQFFAVSEANSTAVFFIASDNSTVVKLFHTAILDFGDGTDISISDFREEFSVNLSHNVIKNSGENWRVSTVKHKYKWPGNYFAVLKLPDCFEVYNFNATVNVHDSHESVGDVDIILVGQETECFQESVDTTNTVDIYADVIYLVCFEKIPPEELFVVVDFGDSMSHRIRLPINRTLGVTLLPQRVLLRYYKKCNPVKTVHAFNIAGSYNVSVGILDRAGSVRDEATLASTETTVRSFTDSVGDITLVINGDDGSASVNVGQNVTFTIRLAHFVRNSVIAVNFSDQSPLAIKPVSKTTILPSSKSNSLDDVYVSVFHQFVRCGFYSVTVQVFDGSVINSSFLSVSTGVRVLSFGESVGIVRLRVLENYPHIVNRDISFLLAVERLLPTATVMLNFGDGSRVSNVTLSNAMDRHFGSKLEDCVDCSLAVVKHAYALSGNYSVMMTVRDANRNLDGVFSSVIVPMFITVETLNAYLNSSSLFCRLHENGSVELQLQYSSDLPNLTVIFDFGDTNTSELLFMSERKGNLDSDEYEDSTIVARHSYSGIGPYKVQATIENDAGSTFVLEKWIMVTPCMKPVVTVFGGGNSAHQNSTVFSIHQTIILNASYVSNCTYVRAVYAKWTLYRQSEENMANYSKYDSTVNQETFLNVVFPGFSLQPGNFRIHSEVILADENGTILASDGTNVWFSIESYLPAMKLVSDRYTYTLTDDVTLNVIITFNRKMTTSEVILYSFACLTTPDYNRKSSIWFISGSVANQTVSGDCFGEGRKPFYETKEPSLTFPAHLLRFDTLPTAYCFHILALDPKTLANTSATARIILLKGIDPVITITCLRNCNSSIDPRSFVILSVGCSGCGTETEVDIKWEILSESDHGGSVEAFGEEYMRTEMNGRRVLVNGAIFANSTADYRFTVQVVQRDGTSASAWYSYRGVGAEGRNPLAAASSSNEQSGSKVSGLWFLWLLVLVVAIVVGIVLIKHYVVDRKNRPEKIRPKTEMDETDSVATISDDRLDTDVATPSRDVSVKYTQPTTYYEPTPAEKPTAAETPKKGVTFINKDNLGPLAGSGCLVS